MYAVDSFQLESNRTRFESCRKSFDRLPCPCHIQCTKSHRTSRVWAGGAAAGGTAARAGGAAAGGTAANGAAGDGSAADSTVAGGTATGSCTGACLARSPADCDTSMRVLRGNSGSTGGLGGRCAAAGSNCTGDGAGDTGGSAVATGIS